MSLTITNSRLELQCFPVDVALSDGSTVIPADEYVTSVAVGYTATDDDGTTSYTDGIVSLSAPESKDPSSFTAFASLEKAWGDAIAEQWRTDNDVDAKLAADIEIIKKRPKIIPLPWDTA